MSTASLNPALFAREVLLGIGAPESSGNITFVEEWEAKEGGNWVNTAHYNPLNTSLAEPGSVNYSTGKAGSGVQSYKNWGSGLKATIVTLLGGYYTGVVSGLQKNDQAGALTALKSSPWDSAHYSSGWVSPATAAAYAKAHAAGGTLGAGGGKGLGGDVVQWGKDAANVPGKIIGGAASGVTGAVDSAVGGIVSPLVKDAKTGAAYVGFVGAGIVLAIGGLLALTKGPRDRVKAKGEQAGKTAAEVAAVAA
jgi:hypothetical protein